ncbi:MAG: hypothetical protein QM687_06300 [Ferruginibacter sp.]
MKQYLLILLILISKNMQGQTTGFTFIDGNANCYFVSDSQVVYKPVTKLQSSSGEYSGGNPQTIPIDSTVFLTLQEVANSIVNNKKIHIENHIKGSGVITIVNQTILFDGNSNLYIEINRLLKGILEGREINRILVIDGTLDSPVKYGIQPTVEQLLPVEIEAVKNAATSTVVDNRIAKQSFKKSSKADSNFEILDVADGYFVSRELQARAYLYQAYSKKARCNYQGVVVFSILNNGKKMDIKAHYVYSNSGDRYIQALPDLNKNFLNEIGIFSVAMSEIEIYKNVRIIEFSKNGVMKPGVVTIYKKKHSLETAVKLYLPNTIATKSLLQQKKWIKENAVWKRDYTDDKRPLILKKDMTKYITIVKPLIK